MTHAVRALAAKAEPVHHQLLHYIYENHLTENTQPNIRRVFTSQFQYGWIALAANVQGMREYPAQARSYPSLLWKIDREGYSYYRMNLSYTSKRHLKRQLRWLVAFVLDFDEKQLSELQLFSAEDVIRHVESAGYAVSGVVRTSSGFHVYLPLKPLEGQWNGSKTIQRYDRVYKWLAIKLGADPRAASAEHYFRTPKHNNVVYFQPVDKPDFTFYEQRMAEAVPAFREMAPLNYGRLLQQKPLQRMLAGECLEAELFGHKLGRNNAAFTLALAMKADGYTQEQAEIELKAWYESIPTHDFSRQELSRTIRSAYEGKYAGPSPLYVRAFTGENLRPLTKKIDREERQRDHFHEIRADVLAYLADAVRPADLIQGDLAIRLGVALRSLKYVLSELVQEGLIRIEKIREGRSYFSRVYLVETESTSENVEDRSPEEAASEKESLSVEEVPKKPDNVIPIRWGQIGHAHKEIAASRETSPEEDDTS